MSPPAHTRRWSARVRGLRRSEDRGAVGTVFAVLLGTGVLLGMLALVVDVGRLYVERDELQNGADSAALALARACAEGEPACAPDGDLAALAKSYADQNSGDGSSTVASICGKVPGRPDVLPCDAQPENLTGCIGTPPDDKYIEVHVRTELADGSTVLPPSFGKALAGDAHDGTTVGACARAAWGELAVLALTINQCVLQDATPIAPGDLMRARDEYAVQFWFWDAPPCESSDASANPPVPNIAGLLDGADANCEIAITTDGVIAGQFIENIPLATASAACVARIRAARNAGEIIYLPVYGARTLGPSPSFQHLYVAPFVVTAFQFGAPPSGDPPYDPEDYREGSALLGSDFSADPCGTSDVGYRCLTGVFVGDPIDITQLTGHSQIRLVG